jgi:hypothetical protein
MPEFRSVLQLSALNGLNGFQLSGEAAGDFSGSSVASAGDVNGDGFTDVIVGAPGADPNGTDSGASYVVFGKAGGFAANLRLSSLNGTNGFQLSGEAAGDVSGRSVVSAGDVNGDGFSDVIVGASGNDAKGAVYVVFGGALGFVYNLQLSSLNGSNGFQISGESIGDGAGASVAFAGDVNGDGLADLLVGGPGANPNGDYSGTGTGYVIFGRASGFGSNLQLSGLDGANGFRISGPTFAYGGSLSVVSAGDVNGDGFDDLGVVVVGTSHPYGAPAVSYVVFRHDLRLPLKPATVGSRWLKRLQDQ